MLIGCGGNTDNPPPARQHDQVGAIDPSEHDAAAAPETITIPAIEVEADLVELGLEEDGAMQTPEYSVNQAGWYIEGPRPGEDGSAVITGHVDSKDGPDVFAELADLTEGDAVIVTDSVGNGHVWEVSHAEQHDKTELPYEQIWEDTDEPLLRLITCAGDYVNDEYEDNLIVYANPLP